MVEVRLRPWRLDDSPVLATMIADEHLRPWSAGDDVETWIQREVAQRRGPSRAICLPDDERAIGRVALRLPEFASDAVRCDAIEESDQPAGELSYGCCPKLAAAGSPTPPSG